MISSCRGKTKVRVATEERVPTLKDTTPLYAEGAHILDGLIDDKVDSFLEDHPRIVPLFDIDIMEGISLYVSKPAEGDQDIVQKPNLKSVEELQHAIEALERELAISQ